MRHPRLPQLPKNVEELAYWYMRYISPLSLIAALLLDYFVLLRRVDLWIGNLLLFFYLALAAVCITLMNVIEAGRLRHPRILMVTPIIPVVAQFAFGGLFAAYLSLYSRSAAVEISWIFIILIAALLIGNERFVRLYTRFVFQFSVFFTVLFSFFIFFLPVISGKIGPYMFLASGAASLIVVTGFYYFLLFLVPERARAESTKLARSIAIIFLTFNVLYFSGAIPPLPLALKDAGIYHGITRIENEYRLLGEPTKPGQIYLRYSRIFHSVPGESAYVYTAIFAPIGLNTTISHKWQRYDVFTEEWITEVTIPFYVVGGRDGGYRGYSIKSNIIPGKWRVDVVTEFGQLIGRVSFTAVETNDFVPVEVFIR